MHLCLFEDDRAPALYPLARTRATYDLRLGRRTLLQTTRDAFPENTATLLHARPLLRAVTAAENDLGTPEHLPDGADVLFVNGRFVAAAGDALDAIREGVRTGEPRAFLAHEGERPTLVAAFVPSRATADLPPGPLARSALTPAAFAELPETTLPDAPLVSGLPDLLGALEPALRRDFAAHAGGPDERGADGADLPDGARLVVGERVYVAPGATVRPGAVVSGADGPVFIGEGATVMENAVVRGPVYVGPRCEVKPQAHIEASALGFYCKVGGEVEGSVVHSLSNKAHGGFVGDSYLGRWCNLGAGTITSNLKNDYGEVRVWNGATGEVEGSGRPFAGLFMGDHAKCGIGTCFNTGTVVDVFANLFDPEGFPPRYVPPFSWGRPRDGFGEDGFTPYRLEKALRVAEAVMARRDRTLSEAQRRVLAAVAEGRRGGGGEGSL